MKALDLYKIPVKSVLEGAHTYTFEVNHEFFTLYDESPINQCDLVITVFLEKKPSLIDLDFRISGTVKSPCDRCLAQIDLPLDFKKRMLVKYDEFDKEDEEEIIYISKEDAFLDVSDLIYEFSILALPMIKVIDCEENGNKYCDKEVLKFYDHNEDQELDQNEKKDPSGIWKSLKDIKFN